MVDFWDALNERTVNNKSAASRSKDNVTKLISYDQIVFFKAFLICAEFLLAIIFLLVLLPDKELLYTGHDSPVHRSLFQVR